MSSTKIDLKIACMRAFSLFSFVLVFQQPVWSQSNTSISLRGLPATLNGAEVVAIDADGKTSRDTIDGRRASVDVSAKTARLFILDDGQIIRTVVAPVCTSDGCKRQNAVLSFKKNRTIRIAKDKNDGLLFMRGLKRKIASSTNRRVRETSEILRTAVSSNGLAAIESEALSQKGLRALDVEDVDGDNDGLVQAFDVDDDGDGVLDNYDADTELPGGTVETAGLEFPIFSNFKLNIENSLNLHATGIETSKLDELLAQVQTLAIGVAGAENETTELDCGGLTYCSPGGTGQKQLDQSSFPGAAGGANDVDSDGLGEISEGPTGDFQLLTGASAASIGGGDTLLQVVTSGSDEREASGMLNFVFNSAPALKTLQVNEQAVDTVDYEASPILGSNTNCFSAPASGDVSITIEAWRPQRPGVAEAGEGEFVDIGNSLLVFDIPNRPCELENSGGCSDVGPGNCVASSYETSDPNLSVGSNGVEDQRGDVDADASNTFALTVNISDCLSSAPGGAIAWDAGETLFIDLQAKSSYGDNAAQKFCITRAANG